MAERDTKMIAVEIVSVTAEHAARERVIVPTSTSVLAALNVATSAEARSAANEFVNVVHVADSNVGVWGRRVLPTTTLNEGDRIELYRTVTADAKTARLARAREQGYRWQGRTRRAAAAPSAGVAPTSPTKP